MWKLFVSSHPPCCPDITIIVDWTLKKILSPLLISLTKVVLQPISRYRVKGCFVMEQAVSQKTSHSQMFLNMSLFSVQRVSSDSERDSSKQVATNKLRHKVVEHISLFLFSKHPHTLSCLFALSCYVSQVTPR